MQKMIKELMEERKDVVLIFQTIGGAKFHAKRFREALKAAGLIKHKRAYDFELLSGSTVKFVVEAHNVAGLVDVRDGYAAMSRRA